MGRDRKKGKAITGWLILDKPLGMTSTQALGKARWLLDAKKAGHAGTLDPLASGVLPLAFGEATKTISFMMDAGKTYEFTICWGVSTTTLDTEGEVIARSDKRPNKASILAILPSFTGNIEQIPPAFSAIKLDGKRAYDLARAGEQVVLKARTVRIDALTLLDQPDMDHARFEVYCGKGTYVRSLARDIAATLGTEAHVVRLRRTLVGPFDQSQAISLEALDNMDAQTRAHTVLAPLASALAGIPTLTISAEQAQDVRHGRKIQLTQQQIKGLEVPATIYAHHNDEPIAIGMVEDTHFKPSRVFN